MYFQSLLITLKSYDDVEHLQALPRKDDVRCDDPIPTDGRQLNELQCAYSEDAISMVL